MKMLNAFSDFDIKKFMEGKELRYLSSEPWLNRETGENLGTRLSTLIAVDNTNYPSEVTNLGEKLIIKVRNSAPEQFQKKLKPMVSVVKLKDVESAKIWGEFRNNLSLISSVEV